MEADQPRLLFLLFLFTWRLFPEVAAEVQESSDGSAASQKPVSLTDVPATMEFIAAAEVAIIGFFQVCPCFCSHKEPGASWPRAAITVTCWPDDPALEVKGYRVCTSQSRPLNFKTFPTSELCLSHTCFRSSEVPHYGSALNLKSVSGLLRQELE